MNISERTKISLTIGTFVLCLIFIVTVTFTLGAWTTNIENEAAVIKTDVLRVEENAKEDVMRVAESCSGCSDKIKVLEDADDKKSVEFAEIQKDLEYIKLMVIDIGEAVK